jgi:hypothetical protein
MTSIGVLQIAIFFALILFCTKPLGAFMARIFEGQRTFLHPVLRWLEVLTYKAMGVREEVEQRWTQYTDLPDPARARLSAVQSSAFWRSPGSTRPCVQHLHELCH